MREPKTENGGIPRSRQSGSNRSVPWPDVAALAPSLRRKIRVKHALVLLVLFGFGLRLFQLGAQELRGDEAFSYLNARHPLTEIVPALLRQGDPHPPLHYLLLHSWMQLTGDSEFSMRYGSLLPGVLLLPLLYRMGLRAGSKRLGLLAAGLAAISQSLVWISQDTRNQHAFVTLFATVATLALVQATERSSWRRWAGYTVACALTMYSNYFGVFALLAHGLYLVSHPAGRKHLRVWVTSGMAAFLSFLPWLVTTFPRLVERNLQESTRPMLTRHLMAVGVELTVGSAYDNQTGRWLFLGALVLGVIGAYQLSRRRPEWAALLIGWLGGAVLGTYLIRFQRTTFNPYYITVATPAWWTLVGAGITWLRQQRRPLPRYVGAMSLLVLVTASGVSLTRYYFNPTYSRSNGYRGVAEHIAARVGPGDLFIANFPDPALDYYLADIPIRRIMQPAAPNADPQETDQTLVELAARYDRLYFLPVRNSVWDPENSVHRWLEFHNLLEQEATYHKLTLLSYRPMHTWDEVFTPLDIALDDLLHLDGVFVAIDGEPADLSGHWSQSQEEASPLAVPGGAQVRVTLIWRALAEMSESYTVFVHLVDEHGTLVTQHDGIPAAGLRPTFTWIPGERLLDSHDLIVPLDVPVPGGTLIVGMYHSETIERQLFDNGQDAIRLANVQFDRPADNE